jgi:LysM repeat protein
MIRLKSLLVEASSAEITSDFKDLVKNWENSKDYGPGGWNSKTKKWYPHKSPEGGTATVAYGHKLTSDEVRSGKYANGISDAAALALFDSDLETARSKAIALIPNYSTLPISTKQALINACYRGELSETKTPKTLKLMRSGKWEAAAIEYVDHDEYRKGGSVKQRMDWNAKQFKATNTAKANIASTTSKTQSVPDVTLMGTIDYVSQQLANATRSKSSGTGSTTQYIVKSGDTLSGIASKYDTTVSAIKSKNGLKTDKLSIGQKLKIK